MKQTMKYLSMAALVVMGAVVVSCSKKEIDQPNEETTEVVEPAAEDNIVVCTTTVSFDTDGTKALDEDGVKTFAPGEKIAVIYKNTSDETAKAESTELTAGDITNGGKSATFHVSLTNPGTAAAVRIIYPAAMAASTVDTDTEVDADATINYAALNSQDGTLATLSSNLDLAVYDGNLVGTDLPADPAIHNKLAICLYTIKDNATPTANDLTSTITGMTISDGTYNYSVSRSAAAGPIYVAIRPTSDATINYTATDGTNYFKKTVTGKTYVACQMYPLGLRMADYDGVDLSALGADYVAQHGDVLIGELTRSCKISIADGATVTLKGVNITNLGKGCFYAGITCLGDATILLSGSNQLMGGMDDGSQGVGDGYGIWPGIFVPSGKTLTVDGTGSLDVRSNGVDEYTKYAPGIGGDRDNASGNIIIQGGSVTATGGISSAGIGGGGNITITGSANVTATGGMDGPGIGSGNGDTCGDITISTTGTVTAQGGDGAAGIGSGTGDYIPSHCGNILISEGTIVATGGELAAGIGSGFQSTCGTITIENTVTSVTATKGWDVYDCIGCGDSGTCGTVKFGDQTMFDGSWWTTTPTDGGIYGGLSLAITTTTNTNDTWTLTPYVAPAVPTGAINGLFTINDSGDQVYFSQGNLQAVGTTSSSPSSGWTWQFAEHQYDYIGSAAANTSINGSGSVSVAGTVDLFGWVGTSSDNNNYGIWNNTTANDYGDTKNESLKNDWGHNAITNGGNTADMWRTLTREEWGYMLSTRSGATVNGSNNVRFAKATIRTDATGVKGLLLFPDGATFDASEASWGVLNDGYENYTTTCTAAQWTALEAKGCVFLPAAGNRTGTTVSDAGDAGAYWTATGSDSKASDIYPYSYRVYFGQTSWGNPQYYSQQQKTYGHSVRLVKVVPHAVDLSTLTGDYEAQDGDILINTLAGNYKITIADRATVTLRNATINGTNNNSYKWAGITCLGDATIVLEGTNTVTGFHHWYPGIQAAHNGTGSGDEYTLTIKGDGSLTASSNSYSGDFCAAGIGAGYNHACGNILIESGTIAAESGLYHGAGIGGAKDASCGTITITGGSVTATGGQYGAGIGSATTSNPSEFCAAITITGGIVTASGGEHGAGIGSGYQGKCQSISITGGTVIAKGYGGGAGIGSGKDGSCSTITIADGVTQVTATKGSTATNSIGKGAGTASCGTVTIGGTVYYQDNAYVGTGSTYLTQSPLDYPSLLLRGKFTINGNGGKVQFSKGNLKRVNDTWSFFTNQYDCLGDTWNSTSCDLFYWEMTGNYGSAQSCVTSSGTASDVVDWGTNIGTGWKTLTKDEWVYLFNTRTNASSKYGYGIVNEVKGMIILPDSWTLPDGLSFTAGISYFTNNYSTAQWSQMEAAGAVFLPAAGNRDSGGPNNRNIDGYYMSSSPDGVDKAYRVQFYSNYLKVDYSFQRSQGGAVRLVKDAN